MESGLFRVPPIIDLLDDGTPMRGPDALVFSSAPRLCNASDGAAYVVKGPETEVVAAEAVGHALAGIVGLDVPKYAIARGLDGFLRFGSRHISAMRDVRPFLAEELPTLSRVVAFDVWLFNNDRNLGGLLMCDAGLIAIDFEKSWTVRHRTPTVGLPMLDHRTLWPRDELGTMAKGAPFPHDFLTRLERVSDKDINAAVSGVAAQLPGYSWWDTTVYALIQRRTQIRKFVKEIWQ